MGGNFKRFRFIEVTNVVDVPRYIDDIIEREITLADDEDWLGGEVVFETLRFTEKPIGDPGNPSGYTLTLEGEATKNRPALLRNMHRMEGRRFLILLQDYNDNLRLIGNLEKDKDGVYKGITMTAPFDSGAKVSDRNAYAIRFAGQQPVRAPFYTAEEDDCDMDYVDHDYVDCDYVE